MLSPSNPEMVVLSDKFDHELHEINRGLEIASRTLDPKLTVGVIKGDDIVDTHTRISFIGIYPTHPGLSPQLIPTPNGKLGHCNIYLLVSGDNIGSTLNEELIELVILMCEDDR